MESHKLTKRLKLSSQNPGLGCMHCITLPSNWPKRLQLIISYNTNIRPADRGAAGPVTVWEREQGFPHTTAIPQTTESNLKP